MIKKAYMYLQACLRLSLSQTEKLNWSFYTAKITAKNLKPSYDDMNTNAAVPVNLISLFFKYELVDTVFYQFSLSLTNEAYVFETSNIKSRVITSVVFSAVRI